MNKKKNNPIMFDRSTVVSGGISFMGTLVSIILGLLLGFILLLAFNAPYAVSGMGKILSTGFSNQNEFSKLLYEATPLVLVGLSVGFASKTGLFNIGAPGQYTMGACAALIAVVRYQMPWYMGIIVAALAGAIWGIFPGLFKALFNVNEVITSIMFNWIAVYTANLAFCNVDKMLASAWGLPNNDKTPKLSVANPNGIIPKGPFENMGEAFGVKYANIAIIIAIVIAVIIYILLNKTTFGYELKACGLSQNAGIYAGIKAKRNMVLSMVIAGALAGIGGALFYLSGIEQFTIAKEVNGMGFNGIPVALLAYNNPIGVIFSSAFIALINVGGEKLQPEFIPELIDIITAAIIYFSAFALLVQTLLKRVIKVDATNVNAEPVKPVTPINKDNVVNMQKDLKTEDKSNKEVTK